MTKAQALALVAAIEGQQVPCSANLTYPQPGAEAWSVTIPASAALTGAQLGQLSTYCANNGLTLTAQFAYLGVV